jgi:hypothetical protein
MTTMTKTGVRAVLATLMIIFALVVPANTAGASVTTPAAGVALESDSGVSTLRASANAAACPVPGDRVKISGDARVFLIDPEGDLNLIPNRTVYENLFTTWNGIKTFNNLFSECHFGWYTLHDAHLARPSASNPAIYIYQAAVGAYRHIVSMTVFNRYSFNVAKVQVRTVSPISSLTWNR